MTLAARHIFKPDELAQSAEVNDNFAQVLELLEGLTANVSGSDVYQAGVVASTDWTPGAGTVNSSTGVLQMTTFGGAAWLPGAVSGLIRTFTGLATVTGLKPPVLPGNGKYLNVGVELTVSGSEATVSVVSGPEEASEAEALAHPAAVSAGKTRVRDVIVLNTAGVYSIVKERDRRPWARGASAIRTASAGLTSGSGAAIPGTVQRVECSGVPVKVTLQAVAIASVPKESGVVTHVKIDGVEAPVFGIAKWGEGTELANLWGGYCGFTYVFTPTAGSHLFQPVASILSVVAALETEAVFTVEEMRPNVNNGTA